MGHSNVWNSHPKNYGPGSRAWYVYFCLFRYVNRTHSIEALRGYSISLFVRFITHVLFFFFFKKKLRLGTYMCTLLVFVFFVLIWLIPNYL